MIVLSEEKTTYHPDCGDTEPFSERIMYYKDIPTVAAFNLELDRDASSISSIKKKDDLVVMNMKFTSVDEEGVEVVETSEITYDLSGPLFSIVSSTDSQNIWSSTSLENDRDLAVIDLSNILFCDNNDEDLSDCAEGDFSDILF